MRSVSRVQTHEMEAGVDILILPMNDTLSDQYKCMPRMKFTEVLREQNDVWTAMIVKMLVKYMHMYFDLSIHLVHSKRDSSLTNDSTSG